MKIKRIYHNHRLWEEVEYNMYGNYNNKNKEMLIQKVINFFNTESLVIEYMERVIEQFKFSCEHNLTNPNMNKIAFIGQCSLALYGKIAREITMIAWNYLTPEIQERANKIAEKQIKRWEECQNYI